MKLTITKIVINDDFHLGPPHESDAAAYVQHMQDLDIYNNTLTIPYPYRKDDAIFYHNLCLEKRERFGREMEWRLRNTEGEVVGGIGLIGKYGPDSHKDEIGYWLARAYRGKGIMTATISRFCEFLFNDYGLVRVEATTFMNNTASQTALEKAGFQYEGTMRKAYVKNGEYIDCKLYALVNNIYNA